MSEAIPAFPVVHVTVHADGSAHINVAGSHSDYPAADINTTRAEIIAYTANLAARLGRGVRMTTTDPDGEWRVGVYTDGTVVDLAPTPARSRARARRGQSVNAPATIDTPGAALPIVPPQRHAPTAALILPDGKHVAIEANALIGRRPTANTGDPADIQLITIDDNDRHISRVHAALSWADGTLTITDRGSSNGTATSHRGALPQELPSGGTVELRGGDIVYLGTDVTCTVIIDATPASGLAN